LRTQLQEEVRLASHPAQRSVLEIHLALLEDPGWQRSIEAVIQEAHLTAPAAVTAATQAASEYLHQAGHHVIRERASDLQDVADRLIQQLSGEGPGSAQLHLTEPSVVVAGMLTPSRFLALDRGLLRGLVLAEGGGTSHTAILARSFGIPCVTGVQADLLAGQRLLVDGRRGLVIANPPSDVEAYYQIEWDADRQRAERQAPSIGHLTTRDGHPVHVLANISTAEEAARAFGSGAEGVGLFRTEMLFLHRQDPPSEEEQVQTYIQVLNAAGGEPVVLRLLDVGGDKPLSYLPLPTEANPFLGRRGVRWYPGHRALVRTQVRAALRAAVHGHLRLMIPMVSEVEELRWVRALVRETVEALAAEGQAFDATVLLGVMVEVPAAALNLEGLAREADFLCVGTNDRVQYLFAVDRNDASLMKASHEWHPATLRLLERIAQVGLLAGKPVSVCGEMASRPRLLPLLLGLGFDDLSVVPSAVAEVRAALASLDAGTCRELTRKALLASTTLEVERLLKDASRADLVLPLLDPELVVLDVDCRTKEEAIKLLVERLATAGRTQDTLGLEEAVWAREAAYATSLGFGFAVPHCKSPTVIANAITVLRLARPIEWGPETTARLVFLLVSRADAEEEHLRVFARLARRLMDPAFRQHLLDAPDAGALLDLLRFNLSI
jgi:fructose-specific PTS system IIA-like component